MKPIVFASMLVASVCSTAAADEYFSKFGFYQHDIETYKRSQIPACATVLKENKDPTHPAVENLTHYVHLYAACRAGLEQQHASLGVLRVNDTFLGLTCLADGASHPDKDVDPDCQLDPYVPKPQP